MYRLSYVIINCHKGHRRSYLKLRSDSVFHGSGHILGILLKNTLYHYGALRNLPAQIPKEIGRNCSNEILACVYSYLYILLVQRNMTIRALLDQGETLLCFHSKCITNENTWIRGFITWIEIKKFDAG